MSHEQCYLTHRFLDIYHCDFNGFAFSLKLMGRGNLSTCLFSLLKNLYSDDGQSFYLKIKQNSGLRKAMQKICFFSTNILPQYLWT